LFDVDVLGDEARDLMTECAKKHGGDMGDLSYSELLKWWANKSHAERIELISEKFEYEANEKGG
jgi:hypothetical protein